MTEPLLAPLVPAEVDLRDFQYMELDVRRLRDSRFGAEVSGDAFRAGVMLWCASWHQVPCGSVPDDDIELANLAGFGRFFKEWKKVREQALQGFVRCSDGRLYHEVVCEKARAAWDSKLRHFYDRAKDRLRKVNRARSLEKPALPPLPELSFDEWNDRRLSGGIPMERAESFQGIPHTSHQPKPGIPAENPLRGNGEGTEKERNGEGTETSCVVGGAKPPDRPPPDPQATGSGGKPSAADAAPTPRGTRLPPDWRLPKAWGEWALAKYPLWTPDKVRDEGLKFRNHWVSLSGKTATKLDWEGTWQNWCMSDIAHRDDPKPNGKHPAADLEAQAARVARLVGGQQSTQEVIDA